jgi:hypothetical protein
MITHLSGLAWTKFCRDTALALDGKRFPSLRHHEQLASVLRVFHMTRENPALFGVPTVFIGLLQSGGPPKYAHREIMV